MEKIIVNPIVNKEAIISSDAAYKMEDEGIILVYNKEEIIGSVILFQENWILSILDVQEDYNDLSSILDSYPKYTFKYIS